MCNRYHSFLLVFFLLIGVSCEKENDRDPENEEIAECGNSGPQGTLRLNFHANWGGQNMALNTAYTGAGGYRYNIEMIRFFLSDIRTTDSLETENMVKDIVLMDYNDAVLRIDIPVEAGNYDGIRFAFGVRSDWNHSISPADVAPTHPLGINGNMHWDWSGEYIFIKFEGKADTTATGTGLFDQNMQLHLGNDTLYRERSWTGIPYTIADNQVTAIDFDFDVAAFLTDGTNHLDMKTQNINHTSMSQLPEAILFMNFFSEAFTLQ